ncbi:MAG: prepilin-type N-terminal cleavage/methylation domain-containing protein [Planctomycetota bacterium]|nr:MAG: prepilin-type N-terminal cleavage/methylation domain-containing protein [Planctomycetota bacterium]REJ98592.1 MAG: prepilin-type N-terminal cleavage/methylation domain-containing protein [Planctomycetota bacterium]REK29892.1 MAG: prepilin-type N-terminal cleavage/methylation domain-containing protein [Planctomycetota bacterium]REK47938.1 MAG: prepilin-type N-terminal cleavage/methylation domain-containing protein [Planctomycetota bacterium]
MKLREPKNRRGLTLLEVIIASTILTVVVSSITILMRTGREAWQTSNDDHARLEAAHATVRHIVRRVRQANSVSAISGPTDNSGSLSLLMDSGETYVWDHNSGTNEVSFGVTTASSLLGENVSQLTFTGYEADGTTATTTVTDIQSIFVEAQVQLPRDTNGTKTITSWAWVRTW